MRLETDARLASIPISTSSASQGLRARTQSSLRLCAFFAAYAVFGLVGTATSLLCLLPAVAFNGPRARMVGQNLIHSLFAFFLWYLERCDVMLVDARETEGLRNAKGSILVANHPSLLDAVIVAGKIPSVCCIMKSSLVANPVLCGQSRLAGYVHNKSGSKLIKTCAERVTEGSNMLIFPEGTRSGGQLGSCKRGFALLSRLTRQPVQTILIELSCPFLGKRWPFFKVPQLPLRCRLRLGKKFSMQPGEEVKAFGRRVEEYVRAKVHAND